MIDEKTMKMILKSQEEEITAHFLYRKLARLVNEPGNIKILENISDGELGHYRFWEKFSQKKIEPNRWMMWKFFWISRILGITFGIKLMEKGEVNAQLSYKEIEKTIPDVRNILADEEKHEKELINMIDEEKLKYVSSIVLGLNDALVELTGTLAGFSFALANTRLIALAGLVTGIAAALSMAASEYLSQKSETHAHNPLRASVYTGITYMSTVLLLVLPYFLFNNLFLCLAATLTTAIVIILGFNYYISVAKDLPFKKRFMEMACISMGVALLSFVVGYLLKKFINTA